MFNPLVVGYGRFGQRYEKILQDMGFRPSIVDSDESKGFIQTIEDACWIERHDFAIICTPPDQHLANIEECFSFGLPVLCESPLCDFGEIERAKLLLANQLSKYIRVAYANRYNPDIDYQRVRDAFDSIKELGSPISKIELVSIQNCDVPSWGIILDHLSYDVDIFRSLFGEMTIETARYKETQSKTSCLVFGCFDGTQVPFVIKDEVKKAPCERVADVRVDGYSFSLTANDAMYTNMVAKFVDYLDGKTDYFMSSIEDAIKTQEVLENIKLMSGV